MNELLIFIFKFHQVNDKLNISRERALHLLQTVYFNPYEVHILFNY
jgi:hypothetical protein